MRLATDEVETHCDSAASSSSSCDPFSLAIKDWKHKFNIMLKAARKLKGSQEEEEVAEWP
ncbi:hypothetical protein E2C01_064867 [Portunus trituberculatus]|uniref:Uncharacterized protein n=1 Tax=Portunus trituberculatus TaxID=210409 RepID=A0A5B7HKC2_PORTR|nr:hypothetical protein [Portunus trituberculatus]